MMQVTLSKPVGLEEVDAEIIVVAGCALGFVAPRQPPHVLHVDPGTEMATHGVRSDDLLVAIDGKETRSMLQSEVSKALQSATKLDFERPKAPPDGDEDTEPPSDGEGRRGNGGGRGKATAEPAAKEPAAPAAPGSLPAEAPAQGRAEAAAPAPPAAGSGGRRRGGGRSRSRSRRRRHRSSPRRNERRSPRRSGGGGGSGSAPAPADAAAAPPPSGGAAAGPPATGPLPPWSANMRPGWPAPGAREPPPGARWPGMPPPWGAPQPAAAFGPEQRPWTAWSRSAPPETWRGPDAGKGGPSAGPYGAVPPPRERSGRGPRLERNEEGGVSLVAIRVPPSVNNMEVLNEYFCHFGPVQGIRINHNRHEAVVSYERMEDAEEALRWPVLGDTSIGFRPWRTKAPNSNSAEAQGGGGGQQAGAAGGAAGASENSRQPGNMQLESGSLLEKKRKREELEDRRKTLLQGLTDQLKAAMARISDPNMTEKNREKMQALLSSIKEKITALTPVRPEPEPPRMRWSPQGRPGSWASLALGDGGRADSSGRPLPTTLRLTNLPAEMRGAEAEARFVQTLGEGVESVRNVSEDGGSCTARFVDRRHAEAALQAQKVWGYTAEWVEEDPPEAAAAAATAATPAPAVEEVADAEEPFAPAPASVETEAMDSDMDDKELAGAIELAARGAAQAEAARAAAAQAPAAAAEVAEPAPAPAEAPAAAAPEPASAKAAEAPAEVPAAPEVPAEAPGTEAEPARPSSAPVGAEGSAPPRDAAAPTAEDAGAAAGGEAAAHKAAEAP